MKTIELTQGLVALVDDEDFEVLDQFNWFTMKKRDNFYAVRDVMREDGRWKRVFIHQVVAGTTSQGLRHLNNDTLDNQRANLCVVSASQSQGNQKIRALEGKSSRYKGVNWKKNDESWRAQIRIEGKQKHLGLFDSQEEAAMAYNKAAYEKWGNLARLNVVSEEEGNA